MPNRFQHQEIAQPPSSVLPQAEQSLSWFQGWREPVRYALAPAMAVALIASGGVIGRPPSPETVTESRWHQPYSEPVRFAPRDAWFTAVAQTHAPPYAETVTESRWHQPWSEPVRVAPRDAWYQDAVSWSTSTPASTVITTNWFAPFTDPVRVLVRDAWYQDLAYNPLPLLSQQTAPLSPIDHGIFPETRFQYQAYTIAPEGITVQFTAPPFAVDVSLQLERRFQYQALAYYPFPIVSAAEVITVDKWFAHWREPVRTAARDAWYQPDTTSLNPVVPFSYYEPLTDPVRTPLRDAWFQPDTISLNPVVSFSYYQPLSEPVRVAARDAWFGDLIFSEPEAAIAQTAPISPIDYGVFPEFRFQYQALAEPATTPAVVVTQPAPEAVDVTIQLERRFQYQGVAQPAFTPATEIITVDKWFFSWADPVRTAPRDVWFTPDTFGRAAPFPEEVSVDRWNGPWTDPPKPAARDAWYQDAVSWSTFTPAATVVTSVSSWYVPFVDPVQFLLRQPNRDPWQTWIDFPDFPPTDTGKVWRRYWIQDDPQHSINRDAPHDLVWAEEDEIAILIGLL